MATMRIKHEQCVLCKQCLEACPFGGIEQVEGKMEFNSGCKVCKICIYSCPTKALYLEEQLKMPVDKDLWKGVLVYVEHSNKEVHPVTLELIGKGKELASSLNHPINCIFIGNNIGSKAEELLKYGVDEVYVYDHVELESFRADVYTRIFEDCINNIKPSIVLVGATSVGRSLAPRVATRFKTGLTADCTVLEVKDNTDLVQIRPAFGGNIMAQIVTPDTRPQLATVRYKVMEPAKPVEHPIGRIVSCSIDWETIRSQIKIIEFSPKEKRINLTDAEVIVVAGRGIKQEKDLRMVEQLADLLGGQVATTRSLIEAGWASHNQQIGLSGRTVRPKQIITCGVSGAVQFTAGMTGADYIFAINKDPNAPIFNLAHYGVVGDLYDVLPKLIEMVKKGEMVG